MPKKSIVFDIFCSKNQYELTIIDENCNILQKTKIKTYHSKICICLKGGFVKLKAKYKDFVYFRTIYFDSCRHHNIFVNFVFNSNFLKYLDCKITLTDKNYGLPIKNALLNFKQNKSIC